MAAAARSRARASSSASSIPSSSFALASSSSPFPSARVSAGVFGALMGSSGRSPGRSPGRRPPSSASRLGRLRFLAPGGGRRRGEYPSPALAMRAGARSPRASRRGGGGRRRGARGGVGGTRDEDVPAGLEPAGGEGARRVVRRVFRLGGLSTRGVAGARRLDAAAAKEEHEFRAAVHVFVVIGGVRGRVARGRLAGRRGLARGPASDRSRHSRARGSPEGGSSFEKGVRVALADAERLGPQTRRVLHLDASSSHRRVGACVSRRARARGVCARRGKAREASFLLTLGHR